MIITVQEWGWVLLGQARASPHLVQFVFGPKSACRPVTGLILLTFQVDMDLAIGQNASSGSTNMPGGPSHS